MKISADWNEGDNGRMRSNDPKVDMQQELPVDDCIGDRACIYDGVVSVCDDGPVCKTGGIDVGDNAVQEAFGFLVCILQGFEVNEDALVNNIKIQSCVDEISSLVKECKQMQTVPIMLKAESILTEDKETRDMVTCTTHRDVERLWTSLKREEDGLAPPVLNWKRRLQMCVIQLQTSTMQVEERSAIALKKWVHFQSCQLTRRVGKRRSSVEKNKFSCASKAKTSPYSEHKAARKRLVNDVITQHCSALGERVEIHNVKLLSLVRIARENGNQLYFNNTMGTRWSIMKEAFTPKSTIRACVHALKRHRWK